MGAREGSPTGRFFIDDLSATFAGVENHRKEYSASIMGWIVEAHKGRVTVRSKVGLGSTFTVGLSLIT